LLAWRLDEQSSSLIPDALHAAVEGLKDRELSLEEDLDRAIRAKRGGVPQARQLFEAVASRAANQGYLSMSRRAPAAIVKATVAHALVRAVFTLV